MTAFISTLGFSFNLVEEVGAYVSLNTSLVYDFINVVCSNAWNCRCRSNVQHLSCQSTNLPHARNLGLVQDLDPLSSSDLLRAWDSIARIIRLWDMRWNLAGFGKRVDGT